VNIDESWEVKPGAKDPINGGPTRDAQGRILPNRRFPDMKALADYIHRRGLKAGLHMSPGPTDCGGFCGCYQHEAQDARRIAAWGFDFLKYDWCSYGNVAGGNDLAHLKKPYERMWGELQKVDRDIVFNLCQYGMGDVWKWGASCGNSWRTAGDLGEPSAADCRKNILRDGFGLYADRQLHKFAAPGGWNDPDYVLLGCLADGRTRLTPSEQYAYFSLWSLVAAPLIFSGDMNRLDDFTLGLLCNDEVIDVDQDPLGRAAHRAAKQGESEVWVRELEDGSKAVGLFNHADAAAAVAADWTDLGVRGKQTVRDLWRQEDLGQFEGQFSAAVPRHGVVLVRITPTP
jgi:alpha-galactosidase